MIITKHLLSKFVDVGAISCEQLCARLNSIGLEVESLTHIEIPHKVVVGKVVGKSAHPNADKLSVCEVDVGSSVLQIVCGAQNVAKDQFVAVALEGAVVCNAKGERLEIKRAKLRDVESCGMLCSSTELGLPKTNEGIMVLDKSAGTLALGKELRELELFNNYVIEVSITPNRGDCLSVLGIARDISACFDLRLKTISDTDNILSIGLGRVLGVLAENKLYSHLLYRIVEIKELYTPLSMALILAYMDTLRSNALQNFLEYTTYMTGVILNAYRLDECRLRGAEANSLQAQLSIKKEQTGTEVVCAKDKIFSRIGIMHDEITRDVKSEILILEASYAPPLILSEILHKNKLEHKPSLVYRSTRGSNPNLEQGMNFLCQGMLEHCDVLLYSGTHNITHHTQERKIKTTFQTINHIIGNTLSREEMTEILKRLNFEIDVTCDENFFMVTVPNYRHDIEDMQDLAEEILRIYGIDSITPKPLAFRESLALNAHYAFYKYRRHLASALLAQGLYECIHYVFASSKELEEYGLAQIDSNLALLNPIISELDTLRTSLLVHMIASARRNLNLGYKSIGLFEIGAVYNHKREQSERLNVFVCGEREGEHYPYPKGQKWDIFSFSALIKSVIGEFSLQNILEHPHKAQNLAKFGFVDETKILHPYQSGFVYQGDRCVGFIAKLHPSLELPESFVCEIELDGAPQTIAYAKEFSKYQKSQRDITVLIDSRIPFYRIREALLSAQIPHLLNVYPMDIFTQGLDSQVALSMRLALQSMEGTLQEQDLAASTQRALSVLERAFGAKLKA
ncbi:phenylalanine--tRNA ligase subunit beta [uncultured Helicobacter sp.]|uniref:phenylalanine--tRNA ligase subunit beta n=1 Tax=uncultured Helicobacter sp. TaxID=175537 RepID=UPI0037504914